jgi:hypothetical protein
MKRYLLFSNDWYYPFGGAKDLDGSFDTIDECINVFDMKKSQCNARNVNSDDYWGHIFDAQQNIIVIELGRGEDYETN